jgi:hypothetical protein
MCILPLISETKFHTHTNLISIFSNMDIKSFVKLHSYIPSNTLNTKVTIWTKWRAFGFPDVCEYVRRIWDEQRETPIASIRKQRGERELSQYSFSFTPWIAVNNSCIWQSLSNVFYSIYCGSHRGCSIRVVLRLPLQTRSIFSMGRLLLATLAMWL